MYTNCISGVPVTCTWALIYISSGERRFKFHIEFILFYFIHNFFVGEVGGEMSKDAHESKQLFIDNYVYKLISYYSIH